MRGNMSQWQEIKQIWNYDDAGDKRPTSEKRMMVVNALWFIPLLVVYLIYHEINYRIRWVCVMYDRKVYRKSREFRIERQCTRIEQKWQQGKK